jgi:site-specific DNA-methyltransferase (adenine-specific)
MTVRILQGDCRAVMATLPEASVDAIVCDPPYELGFMGKGWDRSGVANDVETWRQALRVLKPGGHLLAFSGTRTYHRMVCAIEDAGFEVRDQIGWLYGSGFPKSLDVSKAIDKAAGAEREVVGQRTDGRYAYEFGPAASRSGGIMGEGIEQESRGRITAPATDAARQWAGWGTALKPAWEPVCVARKPLAGTVAANVLQHGTGALNIDGCRVGDTVETWPASRSYGTKAKKFSSAAEQEAETQRTGTAPPGRWPANVIHDGSDEVLAAFPETRSGALTPDMNVKPSTGWSGGSQANRVKSSFDANEGSAALFLYTAKASGDDRNEGLGRDRNTHPTVKPTELMRYLCRLVTPPGGVVLDPFMGSGSTLKAAELEGFDAIGIELDPAYIEIARRRIAADAPLFADVEVA